MKIAIITYQVAHQKTQDLVSGLLMSGHKDLTLLALPFVARPERQVKYQHRFSNPLPIDAKQLAQNLNFGYFEVEKESIEPILEKGEFDIVMIAGAGILPESLAQNHKIINSHPGFLPKVKGLDSLKWAILNQVEELGVTTHFISEKADEGILIDRKIVPLHNKDSFHSFALRVYQTEIQMLVESIEKSKNLKQEIYLSDERYQATMRMPLRLEDEMIQKFEERKQKIDTSV
jgi:phosphoribosylglycinamide formyltransferase-1